MKRSFSHNTGKKVKPGDIATVSVDRVMIHDIFIPFVAEKFEEMGFQKLWDPDKVVLIYDHLVPASQLDDTRHFHIGDAFAEKYGMTHVHRSDGICHQLMTEAGYVKPGDVVFGTDSHTTTYGCVGAFSSGIGYTEMASILGTGSMWIRVPETIKVVDRTEHCRQMSLSKDVILASPRRSPEQTALPTGRWNSTGEHRGGACPCGQPYDHGQHGHRKQEPNVRLFTPDEKTAEYCEMRR